MCRMSWKSGSLNHLEPSGLHWACYGTALPCYILLLLLLLFITFMQDVCNYSRSQCPRGLRRRSSATRLLDLWVRIPPGHGCLSHENVCCQVEVPATSWSLVQNSPTDCGASLCVTCIPEEWWDHNPRWAEAPQKKWVITPEINQAARIHSVAAIQWLQHAVLHV